MIPMQTPSSLFLAPADPEVAPDMTVVEQVLADLGISAGRLGKRTYLAGNGFGRHVVYAGCSPHLQMRPPDDGSLNFCHVALHGPFDRPRLQTGPNTGKPRCPACRARIADWQSKLADWQSGEHQAWCSNCGHSTSPHALDWRRQAISGRGLVELRNVFPGEAMPSDLLLVRLEERSGIPWRYAWAAALIDD